jgi:ribonuclease P protein component
MADGATGGAETRRLVRFGHPIAARIRHRRDYLAIQASGVRHFTRHFVIVVRVGGPGLRLGITASRQVGCAVVRNRWKRMVREAFRLERGQRGAVRIDMVVVPKKDVLPPSLGEARSELRSAIDRFGSGRGPDASQRRASRGRA